MTTPPQDAGLETPRPSWYFFAVLGVAAATAVRQLLDPLLGERHPYTLYLPVIAVAAWRGGWRPATLAFALGLVLADLLFIHPRWSLGLATLSQQIGLAAYVGIAGGAIVLTDGLARAARRDRGLVVRLEAEAAGRREVEARVRRLAALVESADDAVIGKDAGGRVTDWNPAAERLFGIPAAEAVGLPVGELMPGYDRGDEALPPQQATVRRPDGTAVPVSVRRSVIRDHGTAIGRSLIVRDLSATRELEEQLRQSQKMEAFGQLAGGVAHDFNNLLTVINGYTDLILDRLPPADPNARLLGEVRKAGDRSAALTRQLLAFSRKQVVAPRVLDPNAVVGDLAGLLRRLIGEDVQLETALVPGVWPVRADPGHVEQVLMNLCVNARDAMPTGGRLTVRTANADLPANGHAAGPHVVLAVSDTGTGMTEEVRARIFEPFFTTKGVGKGTGLGLATVHGIVAQAGGHLRVESAVGAGTTFEVYLPRAEETVVAAGEEARSGVRPPARGGETVLVVEDEDGVRALVTAVLEGCGYAVLEACDGEHAVAVAEAHPGRIHLLMTDVIMPGVGGRAAAERVAALHPESKVLFASGYTDDAVLRHGVEAAEVPFLQKPFTPAVLAATVRQVLDGTAATPPSVR